MITQKLMSAADVNPLIDEMRRETKSRSARIGMAKLALERARLTECGREAWQAFLAEQEGN